MMRRIATVLCTGLLACCAARSETGLTLNQGDFYANEVLDVQLDADSTGIGFATADLYLAVLIPSGQFYCITEAGALGAENTPLPYRSGWTVADSISKSAFILTLPFGLPAGTYSWILVVTEAGDDPLAPVSPTVTDVETMTFSGGVRPGTTGDDDDDDGGGISADLAISSSAFEDGAAIPVMYTEDGADISPPLQWGSHPDGTLSYVLIMDDPDAPGGTWVHWVVYDIPPRITQFAEAVPTTETLDNGGTQGQNSWGTVGYRGPAPPSGPAHRYYFKIYALDTLLNLAPGATKEAVEAAMAGHVVAQAQIMGTYQR